MNIGVEEETAGNPFGGRKRAIKVARNMLAPYFA